MRRTFCLFIISFPALFYIPASAQSLSDSVLLGIWRGDLVTVMGDFNVAFTFERDSAKQLTAKFESPDQSDKKYDIDIEVTGDTLSLDLTGVRGNPKFEGVYYKDSAVFFGKFSQSGFKFPLKLVKGKTDDVLYHRPQTPVGPFPYKQEEVTIENKKEHVLLAGTFTKPGGKGRFPAVILITGSGPQDRDESLFGHKPFFVLADYLTRKGYAVLRCDDRGTAKSEGDFKSATTADFATDAEAQLDYLKQRADVDVSNIGIIGHSEGGMIATMLAAGRSDVSFIVLMAGPAMNIFDMMVMQDSLIGLSTIYTEKNIGPYLEQQRKLFKIAINEQDTLVAFHQIDSLLTDYKVSDRKIEAAIKQVLTPWFRYFIKYDPQEDLKKVHCAVLSLGGERDVQVPALANKEALERTFKSTGKKNYKAVILPGLNHLFQLCNSCKVSEYKRIDETINPVALSTIGDWMDENVMKKTK